MAEIPITYRTGLTPNKIAEVEKAIGGHRTLEKVLSWSLSRALPRLGSEIISQDEFSLDVIVPYDDRLYVVYDTT